jgi:hypothetical protein
MDGDGDEIGHGGQDNPADMLFTGLMRLQVRLCPMPPMLLAAFKHGS